ncbi:MAG: adenylate kinase [Deltaproteobacteria bacterium]|nr:adenylate kinase [Deltaproteobacteria bacterium]
MPLNLILMGPPGAGKGTQASRLAARLRVPAISTGEMLREEVKRGSVLGREAKGAMDRGALVPDALIVAIIEARLQREDCARGFILDGFPRTVTQAEALDRALQRFGWSLHRVGSLNVPSDEVVRRLSGRRTCRDCGAPYHVELEPPRRDDTCDACGGALLQRDDDHESVIAARLEVYARDTAPLLDYYRDRGLLAEIDGRGKHDDVLAALLARLNLQTSGPTLAAS